MKNCEREDILNAERLKGQVYGDELIKLERKILPCQEANEQ
jgi:hypothetical protein